MNHTNLSHSSNLRAFLDEHGLRAKKSLSQNFLIDENIVKKIITTADIHENEHVYEIGPGPGALTQALLSAGASITAIEKARDFATLLKRFPVEVVSCDCLDYAYTKKGKVVANLPYQITTPFLAKVLPLFGTLTTLTLMVQKEVAERMTALPGTKAYGSLTIFLHFYAQAKYAFTVSKNCFYPKPKIDSAVVHITLKKPPPIDEKSFFKMVHTAFNQRRKMLRSSLKEYGCALTARPEELSLEQFLELYQELHTKS